MIEKEYFGVGLSASIVAFGLDGNELKVLIERRTVDPFNGAPTLPTIRVFPNQDVESVSSKLLNKIFGANALYQMEQLKAFAGLYRLPEGRIVNIAQYAVMDSSVFEIDLDKKYSWLQLDNIPQLVYDHDEILAFARERLKRRVKRRPVGFYLLPKEFTFKQIHHLYEQALGKSLDKRNFRKKLFRSDLLMDIDESVKVDSSKKPSSLYKFNTKEYEKMTLKGYDFTF